MRQYAKRKSLIRYRFKDSMGCVFFKEFQTDREARLWFDRNKQTYSLKELGSMGAITSARTSYI